MRCTLALTGLGALAALQLGSLHLSAATRPVASLVIQLDDAAGVPAKVMAAAKVEVERTFHAAGVRIVWGRLNLVTPADHLASPRPRHLQVVIVSGPAADLPNWQTRIEGVVGNAARELGRAQVFYRRLARAAALHPVDVSVVLGHVISHELGHLLLPPRGHADVGIMRHGVDFRHVAFRQFTDAQSTLIRAALLVNWES